MVATKRVTIEDLESLRPEFDRYELIEGELVEVPPASGDHGRLGIRLIKALLAHLGGDPLGQLFSVDAGFVVARNPDTLLIPDVAFVAAGRLTPDLEFPSAVPFAPGLAIEIVSPSNTPQELRRKVALYLKGGTEVVWLVRPAQRTVSVVGRDRPEHILTEGDVLDGGDLLPGFSLPLRELFGAK